MTNHTSKDSVLHCSWLINPGQSPRHNVRLTVCDGIVTEIIDCPADERSQIRPVALLPQFVNAHTHLEFSNIASPLPPPEPFTDWIRAVIQYRIRKASDPDFAGAAIRAGVIESAACGVQLAGEITTSSVGTSALNKSLQTDAVAKACSAVSFRELIGFTADRVDEQIQIAELHLAELSEAEPPCVLPGISPHAPYSVHPNVVDAAVNLATTHQVPLAMHLAETQDELELLSAKTGRFVDFLDAMKLWDTSVLKSVSAPLDYLQRLAEAPQSLAIHCNYLSPKEIRFLGEHPNVAVVYCPRTHAYFRHGAHPWQQLKAAGATVLLGTDSRASNPDLSIWKELQWIAALPGAKPIWELLPMITTDAAQALGQNPVRAVIQVGQPLRSVQVACHCDSESSLNTQLCKAAILTQ